MKALLFFACGTVAVGLLTVASPLPAWGSVPSPVEVYPGFHVFVLDITDSQLQDTGVDINPGDVWLVNVRGFANTAGWGPQHFRSWLGPGGYLSLTEFDPNYPLPWAPSYSVIGKLGESPLFYVGGGGHLNASAEFSGRLYLGYNDVVFWDNFGYYVVYIIRYDTAPTAVMGQTQLVPDSPSLSQNMPNPFNPATAIEYTLPSPGPVALRIFNVQGELVRTLAHAEQAAGTHAVVWDGTNDGGEQAASGTYFYELQHNGKRETRKAILLR